MELRTLLFLLCLSAFIIGSLSKQTKHGFKSILHDNMKEYFKNYMVGNFKGVHEKQFDTLKISKWIGDDVSKRAQLAAQNLFSNADLSVAKELSAEFSSAKELSAEFSLAKVAAADPSAQTLQQLAANLPGAAVGKRDIPNKVAREVFANADLSLAKELSAEFSLAKELSPELSLAKVAAADPSAQTLQQLAANLPGAAVGKRDIPNKVAREVFANADLSLAKELSAEFSLAKELSPELSLAKVAAVDPSAQTLQQLAANVLGAAVGKRDIPNKVARDLSPNADLSLAKEAKVEPSADFRLAGVPETLQGADVRKRDNPNEESPEILAWFHEASDLRQKLSNDIDSFFKSWDDVLNISSSGCGETPKVPMSTHNADLSLLGMTPVFMDLFWPFRFDVNVMNQRLAAYDLTKKVFIDNETLKVHFFEELQDLQGISLPVKRNQITFSFGDEDVADGLNRSRLVPHSKSYMKAGKHLFTKDEQEKILVLANKALDVINKTHSELYSAMVQMVSSIAFFKDESDLYRSGSITSALGLVWLDPRLEWTVPLMAEQIVHEFIHTSLYYAELVHGTYRDVSRLPEAQVMSAIRHVPRNYNKSLHAAYVSAGLITFHTRVGLFERAAQLAKTLPEAVQELNRVNAETDVLDESGRAMLNFLTDYMCLIRM